MANLTNKPVYDFIHAITILPDNPQVPSDIEQALSPALEYESKLRQHFVANTLADPYIGLIDVFDTPLRFRQSRPRIFNNARDLNAHYLFPLSNQDRRVGGAPSCVPDMATFKRNWNLFTWGVLENFSSWNNVVVAGGSVLAALLQTTAQTDNELLKLYHSESYSSADVDMFLWGLSPFEAEEKICAIFDAVKASVPWDIVAVRKANVISIHTNFPHRHVQIILRIYQSPTEILIGFDVDCSSVCFDGDHVFATPRSMASIISQRNTVDMTRRSPSYETRLVKYARRGWEIHYPPLCRDDIDMQLYDRELLVMPTGLARLIVLERFFLSASQGHKYYQYIQFPGKPLKLHVEGNHTSVIKADHEGFDSNYDYTPFHIPYASAWDAKRIKMLVKRTEERMFTSYNPVNTDRYLHRHVMVACDDIRNCFSNVCRTCPLPRNEEEAQQQKDNDARYIRGRLRFITANPGQQLISGSFNPINDDEWEINAYQV